MMMAGVILTGATVQGIYSRNCLRSDSFNCFQIREGKKKPMLKYAGRCRQELISQGHAAVMKFNRLSMNRQTARFESLDH